MDLRELADADAQGERAIATLWPGDQFLYRKDWHTVKRLAWHFDRKRVVVFTTEGRTFILGGLLLFPSMITDEHFAAEHTEQPDGLWV